MSGRRPSKRREPARAPLPGSSTQGGHSQAEKRHAEVAEKAPRWPTPSSFRAAGRTLRPFGTGLDRIYPIDHLARERDPPRVATAANRPSRASPGEPRSPASSGLTAPLPPGRSSLGPSEECYRSYFLAPRRTLTKTLHGLYRGSLPKFGSAVILADHERSRNRTKPIIGAIQGPRLGFLRTEGEDTLERGKRTSQHRS